MAEAFGAISSGISTGSPSRIASALVLIMRINGSVSTGSNSDPKGEKELKAYHFINATSAMPRARIGT
jgi:hypothetical protein